MGLSYFLRHPGRAVAAIASDPMEAWTTVYDRFVYLRERKRPQCDYQADGDWESRLHNLIGTPWPCPVIEEFNALLPEVLGTLTRKGIQVGPESFGTWNDGDVGLVRAIYCLTRHLRPANVVETGVAHGVTSRFILEALARNGSGHLWSIDLPPESPELQNEVGVAVGHRFPAMWTLLKGSSRRRLPELLSELRQIDLFIHDSLHSERNVHFELNQALPALREGGAIVVDDIDANYGFNSFTKIRPHLPSLLCEAEPVRPDLRRFNHKGMFGIILKGKPVV
jgi:hypothetical protein